MLKYCKIVDNEKGLVQVGIGTNDNFYKSLGFTQKEVEQDEKGNYYLKGKVPKVTKEEQKQQLRQELENTFYETYPLYKQCNIAIYGTEEERQAFKEFHDKLVAKYDAEIVPLFVITKPAIFPWPIKFILL